MTKHVPLPRTHVVSKIKLGEVSLVDDPMNPHAEVVLMKMAPTPGDVHVPGPMGGDFKTCDACASPRTCTAKQACRKQAVKIGKGAGASPEDEAAALAAAQEHEEAMTTKTLEDLTKALGDAAAALEAKDGEIATLTKSLADKGDEIVALKKAKETTTEDEDIFKGLSPKARAMIETLQKGQKDASEALEKMRETQETDVAIAKAKTYGVGDAKVIGPLMMRVAKGKTTPDDAKVLETAFTTAATLVKGSALFKAQGEGGADASVDGLSGLEQVAKSLRTADPKLTADAALAKATELRPELYGEYIQKRRGIAN